MRKLLFLFVLMFCISAFAFSQTDADDDFSPIDAYYLGRAVAANILTTYKLYNNPEATQYLNRICQALVINSAHQSAYKGYFVMILDSGEFNAFATPGGHIFVTKKLVESASSEDMLAAVIAHELAHIMLRHGINIINETKLENELSSIADWASSTAASHSAEAARAAGFRDSITKTVDILLRSGYSQTQEFEADLEAVAMLAKAEYDPNALIEVLKVLQSNKGSQSGGFYSTHPSPEQRILNVEVLKFNKNDTLQYRMQRFKNIKF
ncbi:MAG: M48 family metalloprotease [Treponema sp.]|jgi:predicted Zn-dependent protease|nr:M48 family metalloprotease [Treponema sp.]